jgi:hypothetical protein
VRVVSANCIEVVGPDGLDDRMIGGQGLDPGAVHVFVAVQLNPVRGQVDERFRRWIDQHGDGRDAIAAPGGQSGGGFRVDVAGRVAYTHQTNGMSAKLNRRIDVGLGAYTADLDAHGI